MDTTFFNPNDNIAAVICPTCGHELSSRDVNESFQTGQFECVCPVCSKEFSITTDRKGRIDYDW